jgi:ELWxxDGT repeat protein
VAGRELWKSDGTAAGTVRVKDIFPGTFDFFGYTYPNSSYPEELTAVGGTLFFVATNGRKGRELWRSDGTAASTVRVMDILPGAVGSYPSNLTRMGGRLFFTADDGVRGTELWVLHAPVNVSVQRSGLTFNRTDQLFHGTLTLVNQSPAAIRGSFQVVLRNLTPGVTLAFASITVAGTTYSLSITHTPEGDPVITIPSDLVPRLAPGKKLVIAVRFRNPARELIDFDSEVFSDPFST